MISSKLCGPSGSRIKNRCAVLAAASLLAVTAALAQAATASADYWGYITTPSGHQGAATVLNAAGCGNWANVIEWTYTTADCSGGGSNEVWDINAAALDYITTHTASTIWAHYDNNYMCLNVKGNSYTQGTNIIAYQCNGAKSNNEYFNIEPVTENPGYFDIQPAGEPPGANLCLNVAGGFGNNYGIGENIILYSCGADNSYFYTNEWFQFPNQP